MIDREQFKEYIVKPTLRQLQPHIPYSEEAVELLVATATAESLRGTYVVQKGGPALGVYQMEPATHSDIWNNFLAYKDELYELLEDEYTDELDLTANLRYATIMARLHYYRVKEPLPAADDLEAQARYWKDHYNTHLGKGTVDHFMELNKT